jgi:hypothetical protein
MPKDVDPIFGSNEIYFPRGKFEGVTKIQKRDLDQLGIVTTNGVPLLELITALHKRFDNTRTALRGSGVDEELGKIKALQEHEKLTRFQIINQKELGHLMEKAIAKARMIDTISGYQQMLQLYIKQASNQMYTKDNRVNEEILTKLFNKIFERLNEDLIELREWEEDGSYRLLSTRIIESNKELSDDKLIEELNKRVPQSDFYSDEDEESLWS